MLPAGLRSLRDRLLFRLGWHGRLVLDVAMALGGLALIGLGGTGVTDLIGAAMTIVSTALLVHDLRGLAARGADTRIVPNPDAPAVLDGAALDPGQERHRIGAARYTTDPQVNALLDASGTPLRLRRPRYRPPEPLCDHIARCIDLDPPRFNESKIGLRGDLTAGALSAGEPLIVQRTDYFAGRATNERALDQFELVDPDRHGMPRLALAMADHVVTGGRLIPLSDSILSNHIGVTTLLLTVDRRIVLQEQGRQAVGRYELNVGGSGSADFDDLGPVRGGDVGPTLQALLRRAMEREAAQETGAAIGPGKSRTVLTGHARYLNRGGKPEFFGITVTASGMDELAVPAAERDFVHRLYGRPYGPGPADLLAAIETLLAEEAGSPKPYSLSKIVALRMARDHLRRGGSAPMLG